MIITTLSILLAISSGCAIFFLIKLIKNIKINALYDILLVENDKLQNKYNILENDKLQLANDLSSERARNTEKENFYKDKINDLNNLKSDISLKFKEISNEIIKSQSLSFNEENKKSLNTLLSPFSEQLKIFKEEVNQAKSQSIAQEASFKTELKNLMKLNEQLGNDAKNLTQALKGDKKAQGNWGEYQLERILEISGLNKDVDYTTQNTYYDENNKMLRPDVTIHLPDNKDIIVDSKVSLNDYLAAMNAENILDRDKFLKSNLCCIKHHIDELSNKEYQKLIKEKSLNYVIMFIPIESAYISALEQDNSLYDYAYKKNVILTTPLSLLPILRTIENLWKINSQNKNSLEIARLGGSIYDKLANFIDDMKGINRGIFQTQKAYNNAMTKLSGQGSAITQAKKLKELGVKTNKLIDDDLKSNTIPLLEIGEQIEEQTIDKGVINA